MGVTDVTANTLCILEISHLDDMDAVNGVVVEFSWLFDRG
jgi:hypothetical protein